MNEERQIQLLYPPLFFLAAFGSALFLDKKMRCIIKPYISGNNNQLYEFIGLAAAGGIAVIVFGFLIGTISIVLLRGLFWFFGRHYEAVISDECLKRIWNKIRVEGDNPKQTMRCLSLPHSITSCCRTASMDGCCAAGRHSISALGRSLL
jgi:K+-transporting ATPase A subunit